MKKPINIVITGAPGTGKTTLIDIFSKAGFPVVREGATEVMLKMGIRKPHLLPGNLRDIFRNEVEEYYRIARENNFHKRLTFFDRSDIEAIAFAEFEGRKLPANTMARITQIKDYSKIFILKSFPAAYISDDIRSLSKNMSEELGRLIVKAYVSLDLDVKIIDDISLDDRLRLICQDIDIGKNKIKELQQFGQVELQQQDLKGFRP